VPYARGHGRPGSLDEKVALSATIRRMSEWTRRQRVFKTAWFAKTARKERIPEAELRAAVREILRGQADDLGGGVFKKRLQRNGQKTDIDVEREVAIGELVEVHDDH
jgi:hypothetical protein